MLQDEIYKQIKDEITNDPEGVGYAGKTDDEITVLLNNPVFKDKVIQDVLPSPINRILAGIAGTPNVIDKKDVTDAKKV